MTKLIILLAFIAVSPDKGTLASVGVSTYDSYEACNMAGEEHGPRIESNLEAAGFTSVIGKCINIGPALIKGAL
jgi:hypothetical protein|tara:strand:- start:389 stop:610 length:222 start_codon:yes stop_codon:yes gene_type:complete